MQGDRFVDCHLIERKLYAARPRIICHLGEGDGRSIGKGSRQLAAAIEIHPQGAVIGDVVEPVVNHECGPRHAGRAAIAVHVLPTLTALVSCNQPGGIPPVGLGYFFAFGSIPSHGIAIEKTFALQIDAGIQGVVDHALGPVGILGLPSQKEHSVIEHTGSDVGTGLAVEVGLQVGRIGEILMHFIAPRG